MISVKSWITSDDFDPELGFIPLVLWYRLQGNSCIVSFIMLIVWCNIWWEVTQVWFRQGRYLNLSWSEKRWTERTGCSITIRKYQSVISVGYCLQLESNWNYFSLSERVCEWVSRHLSMNLCIWTRKFRACWSPMYKAKCMGNVKSSLQQNIWWKCSKNVELKVLS